ncbi:TadE/TadG family type IV pilus assembly protein [Methylobacterium sp. EM32]|uniref:TadE/TadG family type IV pilus assembly protein n=1 Tax=Methylobacterium sp. EM32 TaxID=3163481 RepID=UPI0033A7A341
MMRPALLARIRRFRPADDGLAAIELALVLPMLLTLLLGGIQLVAYVNASRKVDLVVRSISQMISQKTPPTDNSTVNGLVNQWDLHFSYDASLVLFPFLMSEAKRQGKQWWQVITINYASIQFKPTTATCADPTDQSACYSAGVVWTSTGTTQPASGPLYRRCGAALIPADDNAAATPTTLPRSLYGPASVVVIDAVFTFTPTFGARYLPSFDIKRSAYVQPRYVPLIDFDTTGNDGIATKCP